MLLLAAASPEISPGELAQFSIGRRDSCLLTLREWMFGSQIQGVAECPECRERLELLFEVAEIRAANESETALPGATHLLQADGYEVRFRPPNTTDLEAIAECQTAEAARDRLLARCTLEIRSGNSKRKTKTRADKLPSKVVNALVKKMAQVDPQANVQLSLTCPACRHGWSAVFDIASFLWSEINDWAERILREVHQIASAYGWREADILEMSAERRAIYLEMLGRA
jgi:DNA-directed RNA polymerase subunit M/transcription elongation factor TFIIS